MILTNGSRLSVPWHRPTLRYKIRPPLCVCGGGCGGCGSGDVTMVKGGKKIRRDGKTRDSNSTVRFYFFPLFYSRNDSRCVLLAGRSSRPRARGKSRSSMAGARPGRNNSRKEQHSVMDPQKLSNVWRGRVANEKPPHPQPLDCNRKYGPWRNGAWLGGSWRMRHPVRDAPPGQDSYPGVDTCR